MWGRCLVVVAHPDDEIIGAACQFARMAPALIVHVTDGAPMSLGSHEECALERRRESVDALRLAGLDETFLIEFGVVDQQASFEMVSVASQLSALLRHFQPDVMLTHPYEGGHPDHDATALAAAAATRGTTVKHMEFTSYHAGPEGIRTGAFLNGGETLTHWLNAEEQCLKRSMLACHRSQQETLQYFGVGVERFRPAPLYDFTEPPHAGQLFYEGYNWGMTGDEWRWLARLALTEMDLT